MDKRVEVTKLGSHTKMYGKLLTIKVSKQGYAIVVVQLDNGLISAYCEYEFDIRVIEEVENDTAEESR